MNKKFISALIITSCICLFFSSCMTATGRLKKLKEGLSGEVAWQLLDSDGEKILYENPSMLITNEPTKLMPTVPIVSIGSSKNFGYISVLNLDDDDREDIVLSVTLIADMDDAFSFYEKGKGFIGVQISAAIQQDGKFHIYKSCESHLSQVPAFPHSKIEMTLEFRHVYHSYIGGVLFHEDLKIKLRPVTKGDEPMYALIKKGSWFRLGQ